MTLLLISFVAGFLTVLAPCILPLLPVIVGSSVGARSRLTPYLVIGSLAVSIFLFTLVLKVSTALIAVPTSVWSYLSGGILVALGVVFVFPTLWERLPFIARSNAGAHALMGTGYQKKSVWGDILIGAALGPVFSSCSPTYFVILATVLPANFVLGTIYLLVYISGLVVALTLIALLGQRLTKRLEFAARSDGWVKRGVGLLFLAIGTLIVTGYDKKFETWVLDQGFTSGVLDVEQRLLDSMERAPTPPVLKQSDDLRVSVPTTLVTSFPNTDFGKADSRLAKAVSGGPLKGGIPALDTPTFVPLASVTGPDSVQAIVVMGSSETKVYPYNILTWHEIVNDEIDGKPIAITFCPLCGSAIVFSRTLPDKTVSTFGVSGSLLESNMIMYDRATENLWQQSTGHTLAGSFHPAELTVEPFQLLTLGEVRAKYPAALVLSENTGHERQYNRNPYAGYEADEEFFFPPSTLDASFPAKTIMAVFRVGEQTFAVPWLSLREHGGATRTHGGTTYSLTVSDSGELAITDERGTSYPFYFEMWFSVAVQHADRLTVIQP